MHEKQIKRILIDNGFEYLIPIFEQNHLLDSHALSMMSDSDYQSIGVSVLGDRKKLLYLFQNVDDYEDEEDEEEDYDDDGEEDDYEEGDDDEEEDDDESGENSILSDFKNNHMLDAENPKEQAVANLNAWDYFFEVLKAKKESGEIIMAYALIDDESYEGEDRVFVSSEVTFSEDELRLVFGDKTREYKKSWFYFPVNFVSTKSDPYLFGVISRGSLPFEDYDDDGELLGEYDVSCIIMLSSFSKEDFKEETVREELESLIKAFKEIF